MMTSDDISEMLAAWRAGELSVDDVYHLCLNLFAVNRVEDMLAQLPVELRRRFETSLATEFDNDIPADRYLLLETGRGDNPNKVPIINEVRAYLARTSERSPSVSHGDAPSPLRRVTALTYSIGSEFAPDDPFGRETLELTTAGVLNYSRRFHGHVSTKALTFAPVRLADLLSDLERTAFPSPPQRGFQPGPGPATISVAPAGLSVSIDTLFADGIDGYREFVEKVEGLLTRLRKDDPTLADDWGVAPSEPAT